MNDGTSIQGPHGQSLKTVRELGDLSARVTELERRSNETERELREEIAELRKVVKQSVDGLREEIKGEVERLRTNDLGEIKNDLKELLSWTNKSKGVVAAVIGSFTLVGGVIGIILNRILNPPPPPPPLPPV